MAKEQGKTPSSDGKRALDLALSAINKTYGEGTKAKLLEGIHVLYETIKGGRSTTYFGATGKACKELPWSNLLKFFLDPQGIHGFGSRVFDAFLRAGGGDTWKWYNDNKPNNDTVKVEREVKIPRGRGRGRFDIFVSWENDKGDHCAIVVENKLWSDLKDRNDRNDQLKRYRDYLEGSEYKNSYRAFVLSPYGANDQSVPQFKVLTYSRLMDEIKKVPMGDKGKGKWEYMLEDFIETAEKEGMVVAPDSISEEEIKLLDGLEIIDGIYSRIKEESPGSSDEPALSEKIEKIGSKLAKWANEERAFLEEMDTIQEVYNKFRIKLDNQVDLLKEEYEKLREEGVDTCEKNCEPTLHRYYGWRMLYFDFGKKLKFRVEIYLSDNCTWSVSCYPRSEKCDREHWDKFVKLLEGKGYPLEKIIPSEGTNIEVGRNILEKRRKATLGFLEKFLPAFKEAFEGFQWRRS